jgi:hypothetical protein
VVWPDLEVELPPGGPPIGRDTPDPAAVKDLDAGSMDILLGPVGVGELDRDLAGPAGVVTKHGLQVGERSPSAGFDRLLGADGCQLAGAVAPDPGFHGDRGQALAEEGGRLGAGLAVTGDKENWASPVATECGVDPGLAVEPPLNQRLCHWEPDTV